MGFIVYFIRKEPGTAMLISGILTFILSIIVSLMCGVPGSTAIAFGVTLSLGLGMIYFVCYAWYLAFEGIFEKISKHWVDWKITNNTTSD